ncbi:hypothetical protein [Streptomyces sp. DG1A-41]|uniref:hypothetical protein n=1 Tax=Streptomyces sp. DG1A-41 TaxID=3125779 RepID=UPI0030CF7F6A
MRGGTGYRPGPQTEALRQIVVQNYYRDAAGRLRWRTADDGGLPPFSSAIVGTSWITSTDCSSRWGGPQSGAIASAAHHDHGREPCREAAV